MRRKSGQLLSVRRQLETLRGSVEQLNLSQLSTLEVSEIESLSVELGGILDALSEWREAVQIRTLQTALLDNGS